MKNKDEDGIPTDRLTWARIEKGVTPIAKCPTGKHVLERGWGAAGVGEMWGIAEDKHRADSKWAELPVEPCVYMRVNGALEIYEDSCPKEVKEPSSGARREALRRPDYGESSAREQWEDDKDLGILDWDGK